MTDKELQKLGRRELLQMLLEQVKESQRLERELSKTSEQLQELEDTYERLRERLNKKDAQIHQLQETLQEEREQKEADLEEVGSIAEAALKLNGVFDAAQKAAAQYLQHLQTVYPVPEGAEIPSISEFWKKEMAASEENLRQQNSFGTLGGDFARQGGGPAAAENRFGQPDNGFSVQSDSFSPQNGGFAAQNGGFGPQGGSFGQQNGGFVPQGSGFTLQSGGFPAQNGGFAPQNGGFTAQNGGFSTQSGGSAMQNSGFVPQSKGFAPQDGDAFSAAESSFGWQNVGFDVPGNGFFTQNDGFVPQNDTRPAAQAETDAAPKAAAAKKAASSVQKPGYNGTQRPRPQAKRPAQTFAEEEFADVSEEDAQIQLPLRSKHKPKSGWTLYFGWKRDQGRKM